MRALLTVLTATRGGSVHVAINAVGAAMAGADDAGTGELEAAAFGGALARALGTAAHDAPAFAKAILGGRDEKVDWRDFVHALGSLAAAGS